MRWNEDIKSLETLRERGSELLRDLADNRRPVVLTEGGEARGVLVDLESYQNLRDAALMATLLAQGEADVAAGRTEAHSDVMAGLRIRLAET